MAAWHPGQLLFVGLPEQDVPSDLAALVRAGRVGGVILFRRNLASPAQVRALTQSLHALAPSDAPLVIGVDQEGGHVARLRAPWTEWPAMRRLGEIDDPDKTRAVGSAIARELTDVGIELDFAPVLDIDSNPRNPVIGARSFGATPAIVTRHGLAMIEGLQAGGVAACGKHFPGHGDTDLDSHLALPRLAHPIDVLRARELIPFGAAVRAGVGAMMSAHILYERLDARRPATLSPDVMALLRDELGYDGLVFTDDLEMKAVADHFDLDTRLLGPLRAGCDALLVCSQADLRAEAVARLERAPDALVERSLARMIEFKRRWARARADAAGSTPLGDTTAAGPADPSRVPERRARDHEPEGPAGPPYEEHLALARSLSDG